MAEFQLDTALNQVQLQAAIDSGTLYLGPGNTTYGTVGVESGLTIDGLKSLRGAGSKATTLTYIGNGPAITFNDDATSYTHGSLSGVTLQGSDIAGTVGVRVGRDTGGTPFSAGPLCTDVEVNDFAIGWELLMSTAGRYVNCEAHSCATAGFTTGSVKTSTQNVFIGCRVETCGDAIRLLKASGNIFVGCLCQLNVGPGLIVDEFVSGANTRANQFIGHWFEGNWTSATLTDGSADINLRATDSVGCRQTIFQGCTMTKGANVDYHIDVAANCEPIWIDNDVVGTLAVNIPAINGTPPKALSPRREAARRVNREGLQDAMQFSQYWYEEDDGQPSSAGRTSPRFFRGDITELDYGAATTVATLENAHCEEGDIGELLLTSGNITLEHWSGAATTKKIILADNKDWVPGVPATIRFRLDADKQWVEVSRAFAGSNTTIAESLYP